MSSIECSNEQRIDLKDEEFNRVLGGGLVEGSVVLIGGEPGIGKSTLLLQIALNCKDKRVLYVSGEESASQIKMRAERVNKQGGNCYVLTETCVENIIERADEVKPQIIIVDSIQTMTSCDIDSSAGSISQIRESAARLASYAKQTAVPIIIVGHITKDGNIAGPKILEHIVDTVLQFEGERNYGYRIIRSIKNRFGSTQELGIYEMQSYGLRRVSNPSEMLMTGSQEHLSGTAIAATMEGNRPMFVETQALVANFHPNSLFQDGKQHTEPAKVESRNRLGCCGRSYLLGGGRSDKSPPLLCRRGGFERRAQGRNPHRTTHKRSCQARIRENIRRKERHKDLGWRERQNRGRSARQNRRTAPPYLGLEAVRRDLAFISTSQRSTPCRIGAFGQGSCRGIRAYSPRFRPFRLAPP